MAYYGIPSTITALIMNMYERTNCRIFREGGLTEGFSIKSVLKPWSTESQVDESSQFASTCDSVWHCVHLRWLVLTSVEINFAHKWMQDFHRLATQPKSTQVDWCPKTSYWNVLVFAFTCEKICKFVWPPNVRLYTSSTVWPVLKTGLLSIAIPFPLLLIGLWKRRHLAQEMEFSGPL